MDKFVEEIRLAFLAGDARKFYSALDALIALAQQATALEELRAIKLELEDRNMRIRQLEARCAEHRAWEQNFRELLDDVRNDEQGKRMAAAVLKQVHDLIPVGFKRNGA